MKLILNREQISPARQLELVLNVSGSEIEIYDMIVPWNVEEGELGVSKEQIANALKEAEGDVTVRINSRGGEVGAALTIYNRLKDYEGHVTTLVDGYAFSSAGWIAQAGDTRKISNGGLFMTHNPMMYAEIKSLESIENVKAEWEAHKASILNIFTENTGISAEDMSDMMDKETFLNAEEAVEKGFFDEVHGAKAKLETLNYAPVPHLPERFKVQAKEFAAKEEAELLMNQRRKVFTR